MDIKIVKSIVIETLMEMEMIERELVPENLIPYIPKPKDTTPIVVIE